jgi:hypothetical protein
MKIVLCALTMWNVRQWRLFGEQFEVDDLRAEFGILGDREYADCDW